MNVGRKLGKQMAKQHKNKMPDFINQNWSTDFLDGVLIKLTT